MTAIRPLERSLPRRHRRAIRHFSFADPSQALQAGPLLQHLRLDRDGEKDWLGVSVVCDEIYGPNRLFRMRVFPGAFDESDEVAPIVSPNPSVTSSAKLAFSVRPSDHIFP